VVAGLQGRRGPARTADMGGGGALTGLAARGPACQTL